MDRPLIWAHRGASAQAPENTLSAFERAIDEGADGIELDVQLTSDGQIVVCHDERIDRTADAKGFIKDYSLEELKKMDFSNEMSDFSGERIPTLSEVMDLIRPTNLTINIELKTGIFFYPGIEEKVDKAVKDAGFQDRVIYSSFNHYSARKMAEIDRGNLIAFLTSDGIIDLPSYAAGYGVKAVHPAGYTILYPGFMDECRRLGLDVNVWTVNEPEHIRMCQKAGVHAIITNYPSMAMSVIKEKEYE